MTIGNGVKRIRLDAFEHCSALTSVTIPKSVTNISNDAFRYCRSLTSIKVDKDNKTYDSRDNCNAIIETETNKLVLGCKNTIIPSSVTKIGYYAFYGCSGLTSLTIPNSVTEVDGLAFYGSGLTSIKVDETNKIFDSRDNCNAIIETETNKLVLGCKNTIIPNSVTSIGDDAFYGCSGLTSVTIPNSVTSIGESAFGYCSGLTSVTVENSEPVAIGSAWFPERGQATLYVPAGSKVAYEAANYWKDFKEIVEVEDNGGNEDEDIDPRLVFTAETKDGVLMTFKITDEQAKTCQIGTGTNAAIDIATSGRVVLPITVNGYTVTAIGANAFAGTNIRSVIIPNNIASIGDGAFRNCGGLSYVYSYIEEPFDIPASAFSGISSSADLEIIYGTKDAYLAANGWDKFEIYYDEMYFINGIRYSVNGAEPIEKGSPYTAWVEDSYWNNYEGDVVIPETFAIGNETFTVVGIDDGAFDRSKVRSVTIPSTVRSIDDRAFADCLLLQTVTSYIMEPKDESDAFLNIPSSATLYVPAGTKALYESLGGWNKFATIVEMGVTPTDISTLSDAMYASAATALKGGEGTLTINLKNAQSTSGYSFELLLPDGVTVDSYTLSSRHNGHSETMNYNASTGVYSFAVLSLQSKELKDNDGAVWTLKLKVADGVAAGDYAVSVQNAKYSLTSGSTSVSLPDVTSLLTIEDYKKGDANGDGAADIADAVCIVNHVVGKDTPSYVAAAADANGDGVVDIADAVRVVNLVVGKIDALSRGLKADFGYPEPQ